MSRAAGVHAIGGAGRLVAWRFLDGRAGHENQTLGVVRALGRLRETESHDLRPRHAGARALLDWLLGRTPDGRDLPDPDLLLGAGHATHLPLLAAARARGGRRVVLMRPSLPLALFDLCVVPEHDGLADGERVLTTRGAVNAMTFDAGKQRELALVLLGGPSSHCRWPETEVVEQVCAVVSASPAMSWTIAGSPRTPASTLTALRGRLPASAETVAFADTSAGWLAARLAHAATVWVSQDSVSMVYEALTAGAATGLIELPLARGSRVQRGVARLVADGMLTPFQDWQAGRPLAPPPERLAEAERCAGWMVEQWFRSA